MKHCNLAGTNFEKLFIVLSVVLTLTACSRKEDTDFTPKYEEQAVVLPGISNARQLGGYPIGDSKVRMDVLLRSGALTNASDEAIDALRDRYKLALVADFRTSIELSGGPDREVEGAQHIWLPILEDLLNGGGTATMAPIQKDMSDPVKTVHHLQEPEIQKFLGGMYDAIVFDEVNQRNYATFLDSLVALPDGRAAIWHCSHGKDRCGWGTAFVLASLGADRSLIVDDFAMSNLSYANAIEELVAVAQAEGLEDELIDYIYLLKGVSVTFFEKTLDAIDTRYGSIDSYLEKALDLTPEEKQVLRKKFLCRD